jgi:translation initiation factor IF-1
MNARMRRKDRVETARLVVLGDDRARIHVAREQGSERTARIRGRLLA